MENQSTQASRWGRRMVFSVVLGWGAAAAAWAQAPAWMAPLAGSYVGRLETGSVPGSAEKGTVYVRLDGKRDASGDGFVLQWLQGIDTAQVDESLTLWSFQRATGGVRITEASGSQRGTTDWYITGTTPLGATLTRGGDYAGAPALLRWTLERLPGQLRLSHAINRGNGQWLETHAFILEDALEEAPETGKPSVSGRPSSPQPRRNDPQP